MKNKEIFLSCVLYKTLAALQKTLYTLPMLSDKKTDGFLRNITLTTKEKKNITEGVAHIQSTFNNTIITNL